MDLKSLGELVFGLIGGLGLFLLGMKNMSDGMQAVAGSQLRKMISSVTKNRFMALGVGTIVTTTIQSSSITTVMVVGFVNSGLMTLQQSLGVIMGANIGTTITGWIITLKIGKYGLPLLGGAAFIYLFSKSDRWRSWSLVIMGIGMVFFGLEIMKDACAVIQKTPEFNAWFQRFQATSYFGVMQCAFAGCILTILVQSSSATLGITIALATAGVINYQTAAALVLGENVGTTITAYLATIGATTNARRAAYFHIIFNLVGVFWITLIFPWYSNLMVGWMDQAVEWFPRLVDRRMEAQIALTHSVFNIANTLAFISFVPFFSKLLTRVVPDKAFKEKPRLTDLDIRMLDTPMLAIEQSRNEIVKMGDGCLKMMDWLAELVEQDEHDRDLASKLKQREKIFDSVQDEISKFVTDLLAGNVPHAVAEECRQQIHLTDEYESVSDYIVVILKYDEKLRKGELRYTPEQRDHLLKIHLKTRGFLEAVNLAYLNENQDAGLKVAPLAKEIRKLIKQFRREHLAELSNGTVPPQVTVGFLNALSAYDRIRDHIQEIVDILSVEK